MDVRTRASRFGEKPENELPADIREVFQPSQTKLGFVPNVFRAYAKRPEHFRAFMAYHDILLKGPSDLSRAEREAIVVAVSAENRCQYCVTAHGAALRILGKDPVLAEQIAYQLAYRRFAEPSEGHTFFRLTRQRTGLCCYRNRDRAPARARL